MVAVTAAEACQPRAAEPSPAPAQFWAPASLSPSPRPQPGESEGRPYEDLFPLTTPNRAFPDTIETDLKLTLGPWGLPVKRVGCALPGTGCYQLMCDTPNPMVAL